MQKSSLSFKEAWRGDPVASSVEWEPLLKGGFSFCTHRLYRYGSRVATRVTMAAKIFCWFFIVLGGTVAIALIFIMSNPDLTPESPGLIDLVLFPAAALSLAILGGGFLVWLQKKCLFFDRRGIYASREMICKPEDVYSIQLLRELVFNVSGDGRIYYSFEMNLVLNDASRKNVLDHGTKSVVREDARRLARYLNVPVWDAIDEPMKA